MYYQNNERWPEDFLVGMLDFIQGHFPSLQRLSLLTCNRWYKDFTQYENIRFLDIDDILDLLKLRFTLLIRARNYNTEAKIGKRLREMFNSASALKSQLQAVFTEMEEDREDKVMTYWKKVQVVPVINCGSQNYHDDSDLYFSDLQAFVHRNDDGTLETVTCEWKYDKWGELGGFGLACSEPS